MQQKNKFIQLWLIIGIMAGFTAVIFFVITYLNNAVLCNLDCRIRNEVTISLILSSLFGVFIGSLTYYFISEKYERKIGRIHKDVGATFRFLDREQKLIIESIIKYKGLITQSNIVKNTGLSRVKISRCLKQLEEKNIICKSKEGMTNKVILSKDLKELFLD